MTVLRTVMVSIAPDQEQQRSLLATVRTFNAACTWIAQQAFPLRCANARRLQKVVYREVRERFGLSAQMAVRAIAKVCEAYQRDTERLPRFRPSGAVPYDQRILSWKPGNAVSILTLAGRIVVPMRPGAWQEEQLRSAVRRRGQVDLVVRHSRKGLKCRLGIVIEEEEPAPYAPKGFLGVDVGIVNLAVDSDCNGYAGNAVDTVRGRRERQTAALQRAGTRSAKRHLRKLSGREHRFMTMVNHVIAKELVARAKDTGRGIALEDLTGILDRTTVGRSQRRRHRSWAFWQLRSFIVYKARRAGVPVVLVSARGTSVTCPGCGHAGRENRPSREEFDCVVCGRTGSADFVAATNIAARAAVNLPIVPGSS